MLIRIRLENFKSFRDNTELTMISSSKIQKCPEHKVKMGNTNVLKHAVIYGANASGKSNLVDFFWFIKNTVADKMPLEASEWFCKRNESSAERDSSFEIQFSFNDRFYSYGFTALLHQQCITSEWLYELFPSRNARCLFERDKGASRPILGSELKPSESDKSKFDIYADDFDGNDSVLFLTEMNHSKKIADDSELRFFKEVYTYITEKIVVVRPNTFFNDISYYFDESSLQEISQILKSFDTGIDTVTTEKVDLEEFKNKVPKSVINKAIDRIRNMAAPNGITEDSPLAPSITLRSNRNFFTIILYKNTLAVFTIKTSHTGSTYQFSLDEESDGTRRIFELIDMLLNAEHDVVYVVDELERSLHPMLTKHFLDLFMSYHKDHQTQLIFTTHESSIMDQTLFRRDEIWFVERDIHHTSDIYSLDRFKERYDKDLSKAYLEGRYGAIPVFSSLSDEEGE